MLCKNIDENLAKNIYWRDRIPNLIIKLYIFFFQLHSCLPLHRMIYRAGVFSIWNTVMVLRNLHAEKIKIL